MNKTQNISSNRPVNLKSFPSSSQPDVRQYSPSEQQDTPAANKRKKAAVPLELYGGSGKVRSEQPAQRGAKIDIIV